MVQPPYHHHLHAAASEWKLVDHPGDGAASPPWFAVLAAAENPRPLVPLLLLDWAHHQIHPLAQGHPLVSPPVQEVAKPAAQPGVLVLAPPGASDRHQQVDLVMPFFASGSALPACEHLLTLSSSEASGRLAELDPSKGSLPSLSLSSSSVLACSLLAQAVLSMHPLPPVWVSCVVEEAVVVAPCTHSVGLHP